MGLPRKQLGQNWAWKKQDDSTGERLGSGIIEPLAAMGFGSLVV
jgi:hypothetical protein